MGGYCRDCGNAMCVCAEVAKEPDVSNCVFIDKDVLNEIQAENAKLRAENELLQEQNKKLEECDSCKYWDKAEFGEKFIRYEAALDESLAIIAHICPDTYNNSEAIKMISDELLKALNKEGIDE